MRHFVTAFTVDRTHDRGSSQLPAGATIAALAGTRGRSDQGRSGSGSRSGDVLDRLQVLGRQFDVG